MKMTKQEWVNLFKNKILLISVIAISFIPILYSSIFDKSVWDPYGRAKDLPVAVVNEDQSIELMGKKMAIGDQVVSNLKKNHQLDWHFVSKKEAEKGMKDLKYYMIVNITKDFSKNAASVITSNPQKMELNYITNDSLNYIAQEISTVGVTALEAQVREQVVASYAEAVVMVGETLLSGMGQAADGADELATGGEQLQKGLKEYTQGVSQANDGSDQLADGTNQLKDQLPTLSSGVDQLDSGANTLSGALNQIEQGVRPLQNNLGSITADIDQLATGSAELAKALETFESNLDAGQKNALDQELKKIRTEIDRIVGNKETLLSISAMGSGVANQANAVRNALSGVGANLSRIDHDMNAFVANLLAATTLTPDEQASIVGQIVGKTEAILDAQVQSAQAEVNAALAALEGEVGALEGQANQLANSANEVSAVASAMADSASQLDRAVQTLESGIANLASLTNQAPDSGQARNLVSRLNQVSGDLTKLANTVPTALGGIDQLASGGSQLSAGLDQLKGQIPNLASGVDQLNSGADQLRSGLHTLSDNSPALLSGVGQLEGGASELAQALTAGITEGDSLKITKKNINQFAAPTKLTLTEYSKVKNYGVALAPYIMSLALFVGCMLFNFVYPIRRVSMTGQSSRDWWMSKAVLGFTVSSVMGLIQATIMLLIGLPVDNVGQFYLTALMAAWCYMAITMFLAMTFDNPGRFVAMILLVLQLGGAGGTFPVQLQSNFFKVIHPYLPMSYSVYAFREAISGGMGLPLFTKSILILFVLFVLFIALLRVSMGYLQKHHLENESVLNDNQKLQALEK
ncbi:YhgE/Pip family protein [Enterococcus sp. LJL98]